MIIHTAHSVTCNRSVHTYTRAHTHTHMHTSAHIYIHVLVIYNVRMHSLEVTRYSLQISKWNMPQTYPSPWKRSYINDSQRWGSISEVGITGHAVASISIPTHSLTYCICMLHSYVHVLSYVHTLIVCMGSHVYTGAVLTS